jgi:hypothetical protein
MSYAMSPNAKRMMVAKQGMNKQGMNSSNYAAIPTPKHVGPATQSTGNGNYSNQYAAQQSNQPNKNRVARRPQPQNAQQMMYQQ